MTHFSSSQDQNMGDVFKQGSPLVNHLHHAPTGRVDLPPTFSPSEHDVICGKGKESFNHNKNFRKMVALHLQSYSDATSRVAKSSIVSQIVENVRSRSCEGGFVKRDTSTGLWYEVGDHLAREKVGQTLRDSLHGQYRSSTKAKKSRRQNNQAEASLQFNEISSFNIEISSTIENLMVKVDSTSSDSQLADLFTQANLDILNELNRLNQIRDDATGADGELPQQ